MIDRLIWWCITPWCHLENTARRVGHWVMEKGMDQYVCAISRRISNDEEDEL